MRRRAPHDGCGATGAAIVTPRAARRRRVASRRIRWLRGAFGQFRAALAASLPEDDCQQVETSALLVKHVVFAVRGMPASAGSRYRGAGPWPAQAGGLGAGEQELGVRGHRCARAPGPASTTRPVAGKRSHRRRTAAGSAGRTRPAPARHRPGATWPAPCRAARDRSCRAPRSTRAPPARPRPAAVPAPAGRKTARHRSARRKARHTTRRGRG
jgi:hypothetical protein